MADGWLLFWQPPPAAAGEEARFWVRAELLSRRERRTLDPSRPRPDVVARVNDRGDERGWLAGLLWPGLLTVQAGPVLSLERGRLVHPRHVTSLVDADAAGVWERQRERPASLLLLGLL